MYEYKVDTWVPEGGIVSQLRTFFVGQSPEIEDCTYVAIPNGFQVIFGKNNIIQWFF
jgi:hypothetical protein